MSEPSHLTKTGVDTQVQVASGANLDQPGPARTPGTRTPRRVQWAPAVDEDEDYGDHHELETVDEDDGDRHELDQAGLDVCRFSYPFKFFNSQFSFFTARCLPNAHSCSRTSSSLKFLHTASDSDRVCSCPTVPTASIIYATLDRVLRAGFSQTPLI